MPVNYVQWQILSAIISLISFLLCALSWLIALLSASQNHSSSLTMENFAQGCSSSGLALGLGTKGLGIHVIAMGVCGTIFVFNVIKYFKNRKDEVDEKSAAVLIENTQFNEKQCYRCSVLFNPAKNQKRILCIKCNRYVCRGCSKWDPKCLTRNCRSCIGSDELPSPEWIHSKILERCRRFESAKKLMAMQKGSEECENDIENDSGYNGPCLSPDNSSDINISVKKGHQDVDGGLLAFNGENDMDPSALYLHEHIESIVENLIGDSLENVSLEPLFQNPEYERMIEIYHRRISDALSQLIQSIQQAQANMKLTTDQTPTSTHSALKYIVRELIEEAKELPLLVNCSIEHFSPSSSAYFLKDEEFAEQSYEEILSTAIINKVIMKYQEKKSYRPYNDIDDRLSMVSQTSSVSHKEIQTDLFLPRPTPLPRKVKSAQQTSSISDDDSRLDVTSLDGGVEDFSWAKDLAVRSPAIEYTIEEHIEEIVTTVGNVNLDRKRNVAEAVNEPLVSVSSVSRLDCVPDLDSYFQGFEFVQSHKVPFPEFGVDICVIDDEKTVIGGSNDDGDDENSSHTNVKALIDNWEKNWLFRKKKSVSPFTNMGNYHIGEDPIAMLVPNPQEEIRVKIGNRDIDELSDISDKNIDDDILDKNSDIVTDSSSEVDNSNLGLEIIANILHDEIVEEHLVSSNTDDETVNYNADFSLDEHVVSSSIYNIAKSSKTLEASPNQTIVSPEKEIISTNEADVAVNIISSDEKRSKMMNNGEQLENSTVVPKKQSIRLRIQTWEARQLSNKNRFPIILHKDELSDSDEEQKVSRPLSRPSVTPGTIAEREHKKWENAVPMPNNPYTAENIAKRALDRSISFTGKSSSSSWSNDDSQADIPDHVETINCSLQSLDLSKYERDYFVNGSNSAKKVSRTGSCPTQRPKALERTTIKKEPECSSSNSSISSEHTRTLSSDDFSVANLEGKVARAVALVNKNDNEINQIRQNLKEVKRDFKNRRKASEDLQSKDSILNEFEAIVPVPIPSPRSSQRRIKSREELASVEQNDATENTVVESSPVKRVHSLTARSLSKEFRQGALQNTPKQINRNVLVVNENKSHNALQNTNNIHRQNKSNLFNETFKPIQDFPKRRLPWVENDNLEVESKYKKKISNSIANRANFWDRRVRENRMTDQSMCDEFPPMEL